MARSSHDFQYSVISSRTAKAGRGLRRSAIATAVTAVVEPLERRQLMSVSLVSVNFQGTGAGNGPSDEASVTSDGKFIAFSSFATDLVAGDSNKVEAVYLRNTQTNTTTLVSVGMAGQAANDNSYSPKVSDDGRFVTFASKASNLVANDTNAVADVFVRDMTLGTTTRISITPNGSNANGFSGEPVISANGQFVAFSSFADNLTANATNGHDNVYLRNLTNGTTKLISANTSGISSNGTSYDPSISAGGSFVTFRSSATDLESNVPAVGGVFNVYLRNVGANTTSLISADAAGTAGGNKDSTSAAVNNDGTFVVFRSGANNLVANDNNNDDDVFLRNTATGTTTLLSVDFARTGSAHGLSEFPSVSNNGRYASFSSTAPDLIPSDTNSNEQVFVRDLVAGPIYLVSTDQTTGAPANAASYHTYTSGNGSFVSFTSAATDLVPLPNNGNTQIYVATTPQVSNPTETNGPTASVATAQTPPTTGSTTYQFNVNLADAVALNTVTIGSLIVNGPAGAQPATYVGEVGSGPSAVATYQVTFPAGLTPSNNGTYSVTVPFGSIKNAAGVDLVANSSSPPVGIGSFSLTVAPADSPDLQGHFTSNLINAAIGGSTRGKATVLVTNAGVNPVVKTPVTFGLYLSETPTVLPGTTPFTSVTKTLSLKHAKSKSIKFSFKYPGTMPNGNYYLVAVIDTANRVIETNKVNNTIATSTTVTVAPPFKALSALSIAPTSTTLIPGAKTVILLTVQNTGNTTASGPLTINLTGPVNAGDITGTGHAIATIVQKVKIKPGKPQTLKLKFVVPSGATAGTSFLSATIDPTNAFQNPNQNANIATSAAEVTIR